MEIGSVLTGNARKVGEVGMKETEKVSFDSMPPLIRGTFLTKEQVEKLKEPFKDVVSVVRCKDCKHRDPEDRKCDCGHDIQWQLPRPDDWFCADGERG